jgi:hypothetical protein
MTSLLGDGGTCSAPLALAAAFKASTINFFRHPVEHSYIIVL